jgi:hypothetical protein
MAFGLLIWWGSKKKLYAALAIVVCSMVIWNYAPEETKTRFLTLEKAPNVFKTEKGSGDAMDERWLLIKRGYQIFLHHPILGVGIKNFSSVSGTKYGVWLPSHNLYIQLLAEIGLLGTMAFLLVIGGIIVNLRDSSSKLRELDTENDFLSCARKIVLHFLILRLVLGLFGDDLVENYWWISAGLSVALLRIVTDKTNTAQITN